MPQGILRLKKDAGGNRHYIELPDGAHDDIHCGSQLEVQLGSWKETPDGDDKFEPGPWISGCYEADLCCDNPKARLILGEFYSAYGTLACVLPLGVEVRRPERSESD